MEKILRRIRIYYRKLSWRKFLHFIRLLYSFCYLRYKGVDTRFGYVLLYGRPIIKKYPGSKIIIEKGSTIVSKSKYNIAGINHPTIIATLSKDAVIKIGKVGISGASICCVKWISIGNNSGIGANSNIYDTDFHLIDPVKRREQKSITEAKSEKVIVGNDVWIASNVTILKGVNIGDGAVIGTGAIVYKDVQGMGVYVGNPLRKVKSIEEK